MRILLYEPCNLGHRPIYLGYLRETLHEAGHDTITVDTDYRRKPQALVQLARRANCDRIFICMMDGLFSWIVAVSIMASFFGIRTSGIYFLFNNLYEGWKSILWKAFLALPFVDLVFVPNVHGANFLKYRYPKKVVRIPDPWDSRVLFSVDRRVGLAASGIKDPETCVFLILGAINKRKGLNEVLSSLSRWDLAKRPRIRLLIAGRVDETCQQMVADYSERHFGLRECIIIENRWLSDEDIRHFYSACSYLCALYPPEFKVSISTAIRAFAVGRPVIVGSHGAMGALVASNNAGFTCDTRSIEEITATLENAYDLYQRRHEDHLYETMCAAGQSTAALNELREFKIKLVAAMNPPADIGKI